MRKNGHFVFTAETFSPLEDVDVFPEKGYRLLPNGRFGYKKEYLLDLFKPYTDLHIVM